MAILLRVFGFGLRMVGFGRFLWRPMLANFPSGGHWYDQREFMRKHIDRFTSAPYRPNYRNDFGAEQKFIEITNAAQNILYQSGDLTAYVNANENVQAYFNVIAKSEPSALQSIVWAEHAHHRATLAQMRGDLSEAARLNSEVSVVHALYNREVDSLCYRGCTACSRLEQFTSTEDSLARQILDDLRSIGDRLEEAQAASGSPNREVVMAYNALLVCKAELHRGKPDAQSIVQSAARGRQLINMLSTEAQSELTPIADYFTVAGSYLVEGRADTAAYGRALDAVEKDGVGYHCLLRIPKSVDERIAAAHVGRRLHVDKGLVKLRGKASAKLRRWTSNGALVFVAAALTNLAAGAMLSYDVYIGFSILAQAVFIFALLLNRLSDGDCVDAHQRWHTWLPYLKDSALTLALAGLIYIFITANILRPLLE